jgi:hypothetical protein
MRWETKLSRCVVYMCTCTVKTHLSWFPHGLSGILSAKAYTQVPLLQYIHVCVEKLSWVGVWFICVHVLWKPTCPDSLMACLGFWVLRHTHKFLCYSTCMHWAPEMSRCVCVQILWKPTCPDSQKTPALIFSTLPLTHGLVSPQLPLSTHSFSHGLLSAKAYTQVPLLQYMYALSTWDE